MPATEANRKAIGECSEESGGFARAAAEYLALGEQEKALRCFRSAPDFANALVLVRQLESHPARESLEWLAELDVLLGRQGTTVSLQDVQAGWLEQAVREEIEGMLRRRVAELRQQSERHTRHARSASLGDFRVSNRNRTSRSQPRSS